MHFSRLLIKEFRIGPVIGPRSAVWARGRRPKAHFIKSDEMTTRVRSSMLDSFTCSVYREEAIVLFFVMATSIN